MAAAKISAKFQVVIPREIREQAGITSGQLVEVQATDGIIRLVPHRPLGESRGALRGADDSGLRDKADRL